MSIYGNELQYIKEESYLAEFENDIFNESVGDVLSKIKEGIKKVIYKLLDAIESFLNKHKGNKVCDKVRPLISKWKSKITIVEKAESKEELEEVQQEVKKDQEAIALASNGIEEAEEKEFASVFGKIEKGDDPNKYFDKFKQLVQNSGDDVAKMKKALAYVRVKTHALNAEFDKYRNFIEDRHLTDKQREKADKKRVKTANKEENKKIKEETKKLKKENREAVKNDPELKKQLKNQMKEDKKYSKEVARNIKAIKRENDRRTRKYLKKQKARFQESTNNIDYNLAIVESEIDIIEEAFELL